MAWDTMMLAYLKSMEEAQNKAMRRFLSRMSAKSLNRRREVRAKRQAIIADHPNCMICGHSPARPWYTKPRECSRVCCHEIANGPNRQKALDAPYAILVLCWWCNGSVVTDRRVWPESRQLAILQRLRPDVVDLPLYNRLVGRGMRRITQEDLDQWKT